MKKRTTSVFLVLMLALIMMLSACAPPATPAAPPAAPGASAAPAAPAAPPAANFKGKIKLGVVTPMTGASAESGVANAQGIQMAAKEINEKGGVKLPDGQYEIEVIIEDDQAKPELAVSAAEKLLTVDKVDILYGEAIISSCTMAVMDLAYKYPEVLFSTVECVSTAIPDKIIANPEKYENFFKACWNADAYGAAVADSVMYLANEKKVIPFENKTVAYMVEDTDYGRSNVTATETAFKAYGAETVAFEVVPAGHTDFYSQINKLKQLKPDVVVTCFVPVASGVAYLKQAKELGVEWTDFAIVYPSKAGFYDQIGNNADKLFWTTLLWDPAHNEDHKKFADYILEVFPKTIPTQLHVSGYDVTKMVFEAVEKAGTTKANAGLTEAYKASDHQGLYARYVFDQKTHCALSGADYYPLTVAQVFGQENFAVWPSQYATIDPIPQH